MKIIIGTDSLHTPLTGVGRYTFELCRELVKTPDIAALEGFDFGKFHSVTNRLAAIEEAGRSESDAQPPSRLAKLRTVLSNSHLATRAYQQYATKVCGFLLRSSSEAIFHSPNFHLPRFAGKSVVTIHDLSYLLFPAYHPAPRVEWMSKLVPAAIEESSAIICVSESTRADLLEKYEVDPGKVFVTPLGVSASFAVRSNADTGGLLAPLGLSPGRYFLCVSTIEPRKNIEGLIAAYLELSRATRMQFPLVLVGGFGWKCDELKDRLQGLGAEGVRHLGFVAQGLLPIVYAGARCFVYPSFYEGFGLPVLEAQAAGAPVICSRASSLPEVASAEALLVDPADNRGLMLAMERAVEDDSWRERCGTAGVNKAAGFSWETCAEATVDVYKSLYQHT